MTKLPLKIKAIPPIVPSPPFGEAVGYERIKTHYVEALRGPRRYEKEAVLYDLYRELNNVQLWRDLRAGRYVPGPCHKTIITEPEHRELPVPQLQDKIVQLTIHEELQNLLHPVFLNRSFVYQYGQDPVRATYNVQYDLETTHRKRGDAAVIIRIGVKRFFYSIGWIMLKRIIAKRFGTIKKKCLERCDDLPRFYKLFVVVIGSSPGGERGIPLENVSSQDMVNIRLDELNQYCVRYLGIKLYTRYMDGIVIAASSRETARKWLVKAKAYLAERLHLETSQKTKTFYTRQDVSAYGFKIKRTHLLLRIETRRTVKGRTKKIMERMRAGEVARKKVEQTVYS